MTWWWLLLLPLVIVLVIALAIIGCDLINHDYILGGIACFIADIVAVGTISVPKTVASSTGTGN
jgi:F0F1-type ATP synthase assembly protein I